MVLVLLMICAAGCTSTNGEDGESEIVPLTAEELEYYKEIFEPMPTDEEGNVTINPLNHFFSSYYEKPEDINLAEFLRYYPSEEVVIEEAEFEALKNAENWPFGKDITQDEMPVPIHKFPAAVVDEVLKQHMGIGLDDLSGVGMDELVYLEEYDAFYNFTSDAGFATFVPVSGEKEGDIVRLYSENAVLTLKTQDDGFLFVSHLLKED
jgi:hypothetical protein